MIVVFDADVLIPMILPASRSARLFMRLRSAGHKVAISPQILEEVREKLLTDVGVRDWLELPDKDLEAYLKDLPKLCVLTEGSVVIQGVVRDDPDDDKILACAKEIHCPVASGRTCITRSCLCTGIPSFACISTVSNVPRAKRWCRRRLQPSGEIFRSRTGAGFPFSSRSNFQVPSIAHGYRTVSRRSPTGSS